MIKKLLTVILILSLLTVAGCSSINTGDTTLNTEAQKKKENNNIEPFSLNNNEDQISYAAIPCSVPSKDSSNITSNRIKGKINNIYYAHGNKVLLSADNLYLYDIAARNIIAEATQEAFRQAKCFSINKGYVLFEEVQSSNKSSTSMSGGQSKYKFIFYDLNLKKVSEFDFSKVTNNEIIISPDSIDFSTDGNQVIFSTFQGLYLYDFKQAKKTTVIDLKSNNYKARSGISLIEQLGFTNNDKSIAFKAQSFTVPPIAGKPSFDTYGMVNANGSRLINKKANNFSVKQLTAYNQFLLFAEDFTCPTGKLIIMNVANGSTKIHKLSEKKESINLSGSDGGNFFATSILTSTGWKIRIYNTETGKLVSNQIVSCDGKNSYTVKDPIIKVIDSSKTCIVLLKSSQSNVTPKAITIKF